MATPIGMTSPSSLDGMGVDTGLLRTLWEGRAYIESLLSDPLFSNEHLISPIDMNQGNSIGMDGKFFVDITPADTGARTVTLAFLRALDDASEDGNSSAYIGQEENLRMKYAKFYANDWARNVASFGYGIDKRELEHYGPYENIMKLLWQWFGEWRGFSARHAACENISHNLTAAPISLTATPNGHIYFPVLSDSQQPTFVTNTGEYAEHLGDAATLAGASRTTNVLTVAGILDMIDLARRNYQMPGEVAGRSVYLFACSPKQILRLKKPSTTDAIADYWVDGGAAFKDISNIVPNVEGMIDNCVIIRDDRAPTYTLGGSNSAWTNTFGYLEPGRNDGRTTSVAATAFDVNVLYGERSLAKYEPQQPMFRDQKDDYDKDQGDMIVGACGYQTCRWDIDTASDSDKAQQEGCSLVLTNRI